MLFAVVFPSVHYGLRSDFKLLNTVVENVQILISFRKTCDDQIVDFLILALKLSCIQAGKAFYLSFSSLQLKKIVFWFKNFLPSLIFIFFCVKFVFKFNELEGIKSQIGSKILKQKKI